MNFLRTLKRFTLMTGAASLLSTAAFAETTQYPGNQPVKIVVGFSAGGSTDLLGRMLAKAFSEDEDLGGTFIVENRPGANSNIAMGYVSRANPDGHTLLMVPFGMPINQYLYNRVPYHYKDDFAPIALVAKVPNALVVKGDSPLKSVQDYVESSKSTEYGNTYSTPGVGSSLHLAGEMFKFETDANLLHVPFKGSAPSIHAVLSGDSDSAFDNLSTVASHIEGGTLRALAVTSAVRSGTFPDIPTVAESGYPEFEINSYFGIAAPAGTPSELIERLNKATLRALRHPEVSEYLESLGAIIEDNTPEEFVAFLESEAQRWKPVIESAGIEPN